MCQDNRATPDVRLPLSKNGPGTLTPAASNPIVAAEATTTIAALLITLVRRNRLGQRPGLGFFASLNPAGKPHSSEQIRNMVETQVSFLATDGVWIYQPNPRCILRVAKCNGPE
jgi:hypothetical protein